VKSSLNLIKPNFCKFGSHNTAGVPVIMYSHVFLIKRSKHKNCNKIQTKHVPRTFLNKQLYWQNSVILSSCHLIFQILAF
jgi:hypothetical protein